MLVLGRKRNESIMIGDSVEITVLEISGNRVRLGVKAPPHVRVLRDELREGFEVQLVDLQDVARASA